MSPELIELLKQALELAHDSSPMTALLIRMAVLNEERESATDRLNDDGGRPPS